MLRIAASLGFTGRSGPGDAEVSADILLGSTLCHRSVKVETRSFRNRLRFL